MIRYRTHLLVFAVALALSSPAAAAMALGPDENRRAAWFERFQESRQGPEQIERFDQTYKVGADGALDLQNISGNVRVAAGRGNEIRVEATKRVRTRNAEDAKRYLSQLRVEVTQVGSRVEVRTGYPRMSGRSMSVTVDYTITVPSGAAVTIKSISGDASVNGVRGEVRVETVSGNLDMVATPNLAVAKAMSGDVRVRDVTSQAGLTLGTISGNVIASGIKVRTLDAGSVSGDVQLSNLVVDRLSAKTINGDIQYDGSLTRGGRYEFNAHSGDVRLILANATGFELDASTFSGSIRSDFPVTLRTNPREGDAAARNRRGNSVRAVRGTFGDANAVLSVRSFSGTVVITKKN